MSSGTKKKRSHGLGGAWRRLVRSWRQHLWPFGQMRRGSESQTKEDQVTTLRSRFSQISLLVLGRMKGSGKRGMIITDHELQSCASLNHPP